MLQRFVRVNEFAEFTDFPFNLGITQLSMPSVDMKNSFIVEIKNEDINRGNRPWLMFAMDSIRCERSQPSLATILNSFSRSFSSFWKDCCRIRQIR